MKNTLGRNKASFCVKISIANTLAYWESTIPPMIVDPQLAHALRYGARYYPYAWVIFPIGLALGVVTFFVMTRTQRCRRVLWDALSFFLASFLSLPLFVPGFPNGYVATTSVLFLLISALTVWIHNEPVEVAYASDKTIDRAARMERVKEEMLFWRGSMIAVMVAYLTLLVSWFGILRELNLQITPDSSEQQLLNDSSGILISAISLWVVFGPLAEAAKKRREAQDVLLKIEA
jgi:hypothetical protein